MAKDFYPPPLHPSVPGGYPIRVWPVLVGLLFAPLLLLLAEPADASDLEYSSTQSFNGVTIPLRGNLTVHAGGDVTFTNSLLLFQGSADGSLTLKVEPGGRARFVNSTVQGNPRAFNLRVEGTLLLESGSLVNPISELRVGRSSGLQADLVASRSELIVTGRVSAEPGVRAFSLTDSELALGAAGPHRLNATLLSATRTTIAGTGAGFTLENGTRVTLTDSSIETKGTSFRCTDSILNLVRGVIASKNGTVVAGQGCSVDSKGSILFGTGELGAEAVNLADSTLRTEQTRVNAQRGSGLLLTAGTSAVFKTTNVTSKHESLRLADGDATFERTDLASTDRAAFQCARSAVSSTLGGRWMGSSAAFDGQSCDGTLRGLDVGATNGPAIRWTSQEGLELDGLRVVTSRSPAMQLTGPGLVANLNGTGYARFINWTGPGEALESLLSLTASPHGHLCYVDADATGAPSGSDPVYLKQFSCTTQGLVSGDLRLLASGPLGGGTVVGNADDAAERTATTLALPAQTQYAFTTADGNSVYGAADRLYVDLGGNGQGAVSAGDLRLSGNVPGFVAFTRVMSIDTDVGATLLPGPVAVGAESMKLGDPGSGPGPLDFLYLDADHSGKPSLGDLRLTRIPSYVAPQAAGTIVSSFVPLGGTPEREIQSVVTSGSTQCLLCLNDGAFLVTQSRSQGDSVGLRAVRSYVDVRLGDFSTGRVPVDLTDTLVQTMNSPAATAKNRLLRSALEASFDFRPLVTLKNGVPVEGAQVVIKKADNTLLAQGTTNAQGTGPSVPVRSITQTDSNTQLAPSLGVHAEYRGLTNDTTLSPFAHPFRVNLRDDTNPSALLGLRATTAGNVQRVSLQWSASTDNLAAPSYDVDLATAPGHAKILRAGQLTPYAGERLATVPRTDFTFELPGQGVFKVTVRARDGSGNTGTPSTIDIRWDETDPLVGLDVEGLEGADDWYRGPVNVTLTSSDQGSFVETLGLTIDGTRVANASQPTRIVADGLHLVVGFAVDAAGNQATVSTTLRVDSTPPTVPAPRAEGRTVLDAAGPILLLWSGAPTDRGSGVSELRLMQVHFDPGSQSDVETMVDRFVDTFPEEVQVDLPAGSTRYYLRAVDRAGNVASSGEVRYIVDAAPPSIEPLSTTTVSPGSTIPIRFRDETRIVSLVAFVDGRVWQANASNSLDLDLTSAGAGTHSVRLVATDEAGNVREVTEDFTVEGPKKSPANTLFGTLLSLVVSGVLVVRRPGSKK